MRWFLTVKAVEEHPVRAWNIRNRWHVIRFHTEIRDAYDVPHSISDLSASVPESDRSFWPFSSDLASNASGEPRPIAGATQERKLLDVGSTALFGTDRTWSTRCGTLAWETSATFCPGLLLLPTRGHQMGGLRHRESVGIDIRLDCRTNLPKQG